MFEAATGEGGGIFTMAADFVLDKNGALARSEHLLLHNKLETLFLLLIVGIVLLELD